MEGDEQAIVAILDAQSDAWRRGDAEAFAAYVVPEVVFTNVVGMFSVGRAPFVAQHAHIFATVYQGSTMRQFLQHIAYAGSEVAIVDTVAKVTGFRELPPGAPAVDGALYTRLEQVMVRSDDRWQVASFHNVPIQPPFVGPDVLALTAAAAQ